MTTPERKVTEYHRLSAAAAEDLEKAVSFVPHVNEQTTDLQAGFMLGVAHVLRVLRKGFVAG
jgi:hypothetical protein